MAKIAAMIPDGEAAEAITDRLAKLQIDDLDWRIIGPDEDHERIFPALAWPVGSGASTSGQGPLGVPLHTDYPEDKAVEDRGVDGDEAEFYGRSIEQGGTAIIIEAPSDYVEQIRRILEEADAQQVTVD
jgi:hypothetical protein